MASELTDQRVELAKEYFRKVDARDARLLDMVTDEVQFYFPKFGTGHGKQDMADFGDRLASDLEWLAHDIDNFHIVVAGDTVIVEGGEYGMTRSGQRWPHTGDTHWFCNVFEFDGLLIRRLHIYVDPDYTNSHQERLDLLQRQSRGN